MQEKINPIRETTDEAVALAKTLIRTARFGSLGVLEPETGFPLVSRVGIAVDVSGAPIMLASSLSIHCQCLTKDARASLLIGEPGKGDPLAHPRLTAIGQFERLEKNSAPSKLLRSRYLARHPKAKLYVDFADFDWYRLNIERVNLNGGFGQAYLLSAEEVLTSFAASEACAQEASDVAERVLASHEDEFEEFAHLTFKSRSSTHPTGWSLASLDFEGLDVFDGELVRRKAYDQIVQPGNLKEAVLRSLRGM